MKPEHKAILSIIEDYLTKYPEQRFGQALLNLNINQLKKTTLEHNEVPELRDIYNDTDDKILERIKI